MKYEIWTDEQTRTLAAMKAVGHGPTEIGRAIGRDTKSIEDRWRWLNLSEEEKANRRDKINAHRREKRTAELIGLGRVVTERGAQMPAWSSEEIAALQHKRDIEKKSWAIIAAEMGRPSNTCSGKWYGIRNPVDRVSRVVSFTKTVVPEPVKRERDHRINLEPRDLTAAFFGDPPVGYSALERRT